MTKKHFIKIAEILGVSYQNNLHKYDSEQLLSLLCEFFKKDNPNFNEATFKKALEKANLLKNLKKDKIYISDEDKLMRNKNIKWTQSEIIKN